MQNIETFDFTGKTVLVRVDFNVPLNEQFEVTDDTRIRAAVKTIRKIASGGAKVVLMSHLGRPKGGPEHKYSLFHIVKNVEKACGLPVHFVDDCIGPKVESAIDQLKTGEVLLLENLRFYKEEEKGDREFAEKLAALGNVYVNDAFGTAHRAHASTAVIADFFEKDKMFGYLMQAEIESIDKVLVHTQRPFVAVMGGAKVSSKISIIENVLGKVDHLIIGGGMTFTFIKAQGGKIGNSLVEDDKLDLALELLKKAEDKGVKIHLPVDTIAANAFANDAQTIHCKVGEIPEGYMGLDIGEETIQRFDAILQSAKTILWNGPMGVFEMSNFEHGTKTVADSIVRATAAGAFSLVGGGDSVAAVNQFGIADKVSYVSTGGGALLEYMEGIELPGVKAIRS
ncbi:MAG: phosphoglycerate kinase [Flavobacteriales bacterium]